MGAMVVTGATLMCTLGLAPGQLIVSSQMTVKAGGKPVATIQDATPANVTPFGMCTTQANPAVAAATAAALGVPTPAPCVPSVGGSWTGPGMQKIAGIPCLTQSSCLMCAYGGNISIKDPSQMTVKI